MVQDDISYFVEEKGESWLRFQKYGGVLKQCYSLYLS